jgi:hypothetical protein
VETDSHPLLELFKTPANTEDNLGKYLVGLVVGLNDLNVAPLAVVPKLFLLIVTLALSTSSQQYVIGSFQHL